MHLFIAHQYLSTIVFTKVSEAVLIDTLFKQNYTQRKRFNSKNS